MILWSRAKVALTLGCLIVAAAGAWVFWARFRSSPASRETLYQDSFRLDKQDEWEPFGGAWEIVDGAMRNNSDERGAKLMSGSSQFTGLSDRSRRPACSDNTETAALSFAPPMKKKVSTRTTGTMPGCAIWITPSSWAVPVMAGSSIRLDGSPLGFSRNSGTTSRYWLTNAISWPPRPRHLVK